MSTKGVSVVMIKILDHAKFVHMKKHHGWNLITNTAALVIWLQKNANSEITGSMEITANRVFLRKVMFMRMIVVVSQQIHQLKHQQKHQVISRPTSQVQSTRQYQAKFQHRNQV